jgi:putative endonuclease
MFEIIMAEVLSLDIENKHPNEMNSSFIGEYGERLAAEFLQRRGFRLVLSNFKAPVGRNRLGVSVTGEIDLIALDGETICFVEVKTRSSDEFASPLAAVDLRKQRQITRTARVYRKIFNLRAAKFRYDVISIVLADKNNPRIELFKNYWTEEKFRKKFWSEEFR